MIGRLLAVGKVVDPFEPTYFATSNVLHAGLAAGDAVYVFELDLLATPRALKRHDVAPLSNAPVRHCGTVHLSEQTILAGWRDHSLGRQPD